jgi:5-formaminoimidazole-4-carboxamide-1-beta-D-ribofuranosyl 5'-monophosphate synthetase
MKRLLAVLCAMAAPNAWCDAPDKEVATVVLVELQPGSVHEECMRLEAGQKRRYYWKSNAPVDFNIHFHRGDDVFHPVKRERMRGDGGTFTAKSGEDYCWMWTAKAAAKIEGRIDLK